MLYKLEKFVPILRVFFPEQRRWVTRLFLGVGVLLVAGRFWEPFANALLARYFSVRVPVEAATDTGWILIGLGLFVLAINECIDRWPQKATEDLKGGADRKSLVALFSEIHLPTIDMFVHFGKLSSTYFPALHYFYGVEGFVTSANFHMHDQQLRAKCIALYGSLKRALSFGNWLAQTSDSRLLKFDSRHDIYRDPSAKAAHDEFLKAVYETEENIRALCQATREKFPDFDFGVTNKAALDNYHAGAGRVARAPGDNRDCSRRAYPRKSPRWAGARRVRRRLRLMRRWSHEQVEEVLARSM